MKLSKSLIYNIFLILIANQVFFNPPEAKSAENIKIMINNAFPVKLWLKKSDFE